MAPRTSFSLRRVFILGFFCPRFSFCFYFFLLASWLFWLLGFLAFRLLGFLASRLLGFLALVFASSAFPVPLRQVAFWLWRLCGFWLASSAFTVPLWAFWLLHPFIGFWIWLPASSASPVPPCLNHHFFEHHGGEAPQAPPPQPTRYCLDCLQSNCTPLNQHFFKHHGGAAAPPNPPATF